MLDGIGRNGNRPQLARVDLWEGARRLAPSPPIKFCIGDKRSNFCIGVAFRVFAGAAFLPEVINRTGPPAIGQRANAYLSIEDVLPKGIDVMGIGHQGTQTNDGNGFERPLLNALTGFAVCCGQGHVHTSVHNALRHHRDGIAGIDVDALSGDASR